jgi:hypothetical protein
MKFSALLVSAISAFTVHAAGVSILDVWAPAITFPTEGDTLIYGQSYNFTWYVRLLVNGARRSWLTELGTRLHRLPKSRTPPPSCTSVRMTGPFQVRRPDHL